MTSTALKNKHKVIIGSLVGAVVIHATMVACSGSSDRDALSADGATDGGFLDALLDALGLTDAAERDARASDDAGSAACSCGGGPTKTAATDVAQLRRFDIAMATTVNSTARVTDGPFVITDVSYAFTQQDLYLWVVPMGTKCTTVGAGVGQAAINGPLVLSASTDGSAHTVHTSTFVKPGESLCIQYDPAIPASATNANFRNATISGYVPY